MVLEFSLPSRLGEIARRGGWEWEAIHGGKMAQKHGMSLGRAASQSSTYASTTPASKAVDGNTDGNYSDGSVAHTNADANAWWQVDLGASGQLSSIVIWNRTDCCGTRLGDYWVFVSDTPFLSTDTPTTLQTRAGTWSNHQTTAPSPSTTISATGAQGRYVRVQLSGTNYLALAEVQVMGTPVGIGDYVTTYGYDLLDHLTSVSMPRATGTQTRIFNYGSPPGALLLSATNPENGTVSYTYNSSNKIATKTDAKGQQTQYTYDSYLRLTEVRHYISGSEDTCQRVDFYYDSNPFDGGTYSSNISGRLAAVQYQNATINPGFCGTTFQEWYSYNAGGARMGKEMQVSRGGLPASLVSSYLYDTEGRMTSQKYPDSYTYDYMGNPTVFGVGQGRRASVYTTIRWGGYRG